MAGCLLSDIPPAGLQAVLQHLSAQDCASLRQVSHAVCDSTTHHLPYIVLRLSESSNVEQLQQWAQATKHLQHVNSIHTTIFGTVAPEVFELAMRLLSQRKSVNELQIAPLRSVSSNVCSHSSNEPYTETLAPIGQVMPQLTKLVVDDINLRVQNLSMDLQHLIETAATAAGEGLPPPLQILVLTATSRPGLSGETYWSDFTHTLQQVGTTFRSLRQLDLRMPDLMFYDTTCSTTAAAALPGGSATADASLTSLITAEWYMKQAQVATVAAIINAAMQLTCLQRLSIIDLPDIWQPPDPDYRFRASMPSAIEAAAALQGVDAAVDATLSAGVLSTTAAAAAAFGKMEDWGNWLLQHHPNLRYVYISHDGNMWGISWMRQTAEAQQQPAQEFNSYSSCAQNWCNVPARAAATPPADQTDWCLFRCHNASRDAPAADDDDNDIEHDDDDARSNDQSVVAAAELRSGCRAQSLVSAFQRPLPHYTSSLVSDCLDHITGCELQLRHDQVAGLDDLLGDLKSLRELRITFEQEYENIPSPPGNSATVAIRAAAASAQTLTSLNFASLGDPRLLASYDMLLPLTAAAGGPGSNLKKLELKGRFQCSSDLISSSITTTAVALRLSGRWHQPLLLLNGLTELVLLFRHTSKFPTLQVESLPASLEVLICERLSVCGSPASSSSARAGSGATPAAAAASTFILEGDSTSISTCTDHSFDQSTERLPNLRKLDLTDCEVTSPSILATRQLQQLTVLNTKRQGSSTATQWAAAAAAWPNIRELKWEPEYDCKFSCARDISTGCSNVRSNPVKSSAAAATAAAANPDSGGESSQNLEATADAASNAAEALLESQIDSSLQDIQGPFVSEVLQDILAQFKHLKALTIRRLPWMSVDILKLV